MITISDITESTAKTTSVGAFRPCLGVMFLPALFCVGGTISAAEINKPAPKVEATKPVEFQKVETPYALQVTDADLQNLAACARMVLKDLTPEQMQAVAIAIKHAEDDVQAMRKAKAVPVEVKGETKP